MFGDDVFEVIEDPFRFCSKRSARLEQLADGRRWTEGPAYFAAGRYLVWSDIPNDRMLRWDEPTGNVGIFRAPAGYTNGNTVDRQGRLVSCEHGARRVTRTEHDGSLTVIVDRHDGKRFNSPNDVVVKSDGSISFTDPAYGIDNDYEGHRAVVDDGPRHIRVFEVGADSTLSGGDVFATCAAGAFDGFRVDTQGRIWTSAGETVECYEPDGSLLGRILVPEIVSNVVFGGPKRNRLFICATTSVYSVLLPVNGVG